MNETPKPTDEVIFEKPRIPMAVVWIVLACGAISLLLWFGISKLASSSIFFATETPTATATFTSTSTSTATLTPTPTLTRTPRPTPTATPDQRVLNPANQHLYLYVKERKTWHEARDYCAARGGHLVTIQDRTENRYIYELTSGNTWLGATDEVKEGTWIWVSGEPWKYTNWKAAEPNNNGDGAPEHFLTFTIAEPGDSFRKWNDIPGGEMYFVCEWEP